MTKFSGFLFAVLLTSGTALADDFCYLYTQNQGEDTGVHVSVVCSDGQTHFQKSLTRNFLVGPLNRQKLAQIMSDADAKMRSEGYTTTIEVGKPNWRRAIYARPASGLVSGKVCVAYRGRNAVPVWRDLPGSSYRLDCADGAETTFSTESRAQPTDDALFIEYARSRGLTLAGRIDGYTRYVNSSAILVLKKP